MEVEEEEEVEGDLACGDCTLFRGEGRGSLSFCISSDSWTIFSTKFVKVRIWLGLSCLALCFVCSAVSVFLLLLLIFSSSSKDSLVHTIWNSELRSREGASGLVLLISAALVENAVNSVLRSVSKLAAARNLGKLAASFGILSKLWQLLVHLPNPAVARTAIIVLA